RQKIACWRMNYQHCGDMTFFPSFSFEQLYQGVRRCWRFGRKGPVTVNIVSALGESEVIDGLQRKQAQSEKMFSSLVRYMNNAIEMTSADGHSKTVAMPTWVQGEK